MDEVSKVELGQSCTHHCWNADSRQASERTAAEACQIDGRAPRHKHHPTSDASLCNSNVPDARAQDIMTPCTVQGWLPQPAQLLHKNVTHTPNSEHAVLAVMSAGMSGVRDHTSTDVCPGTAVSLTKLACSVCQGEDGLVHAARQGHYLAICPLTPYCVMTCSHSRF